MDNTWIIVIAIIAAIVVTMAVLLFLGYWYIKRKIRDGMIDVGASIITKIIIKFYPNLMKKPLDEETKRKIQDGANVTQKILKGDMATTATVATNVIDKGANIITKTKEKYLNEKATKSEEKQWAIVSEKFTDTQCNVIKSYKNDYPGCLGMFLTFIFFIGRTKGGRVGLIFGGIFNVFMIVMTIIENSPAGNLLIGIPIFLVTFGITGAIIGGIIGLIKKLVNKINKSKNSTESTEAVLKSV